MLNKFQKSVFRTLIGLVLLFTTACQPSPAASEIPKLKPIEIKGHKIQGEFRQFFEQYGGLDSFGYPLTEEIVVAGWRVQYFEKGRLEYHPENEAAYRVTAGWLGDLLQRRQPPLPPAAIPPANDANRRYFSEAGHTLSGDFLRYFQTHGGSVRFGLPISEPFIGEGRLTQDLQSARFFWTPDQSPPVTLEKTGQLHLDQIIVK